jgi:hypothetical protein
MNLMVQEISVSGGKVQSTGVILIRIGPEAIEETRMSHTSYLCGPWRHSINNTNRLIFPISNCHSFKTFRKGQIDQTFQEASHSNDSMRLIRCVMECLR